MIDVKLVNAQGQVWEWPCDRLDAHGPHPIMGCTKCESGTYDHFGTCDQGRVLKTCPGVKAHPLTQIGGGYHPDVAKVLCPHGSNSRCDCFDIAAED